MIVKRTVSFLAALLLTLGPGLAVHAAEVSSDSIYCFSPEDFSHEETLEGICITALPDSGTVRLGSRILQCGDVLTWDQLAQLTFIPVRTEQDTHATIRYLPIYADQVAPAASMTISIRGKEDQAPIAEDFAAETYKNLAVEGRLKVKDPEGQAMTFTLIRQPKRGQVEIREDGSFTYTPKKNKVGIDSFVYTATDAAGNVSRESTVTITIVKPTDATQYTDTLGRDCRFAAEWMKNTGIFIGEKLDGNACFHPDKTVTQGEFLAMLVKTLEIPRTDTPAGALEEADVPLWLQPYLAAALRSGIVSGLPEDLRYSSPIRGSEAAVMLQNALELTVAGDIQTAALDNAPDWAQRQLQVLQANGIEIDPVASLTREQAALILYQASKLAPTAPGLIFSK